MFGFLFISSDTEEFLFHAWLLCFGSNVVSFWKPGILFNFCMFWCLSMFLGGGHMLS